MRRDEAAATEKLTVSITVLEGSSVTTGLDSLRDHRVAANVSGLASFLGVGDRDPHGHLTVVQSINDLARRTAEVNDTTAGRSAQTISSLASKAAASKRGRPSVAACRPSSPCSASAKASIASFSTGASVTTNRLMPKARDVSSRTADMSARRSLGVLYPAARKPRPPAPETDAASVGVESPPAIGAWTIGWSSCGKLRRTGASIARYVTERSSNVRLCLAPSPRIFTRRSLLPPDACSTRMGSERPGWR